MPLLQTDIVLDDPQALVDRLRRGAQIGDVDCRRRMRGPGLVQGVKFTTNIEQLGVVADTLGLDIENGDLVQQFTEGDGYGNFGHGAISLWKALLWPEPVVTPTRDPQINRPRTISEHGPQFAYTCETPMSCGEASLPCVLLSLKILK